MSWVWMELVGGVPTMMEQVDQWKASGDPRPFAMYDRERFDRDPASSSGTDNDGFKRQH